MQLTNEQHDSKVKAHSVEANQPLATYDDPQIKAHSVETSQPLAMRHDPQIGENNFPFRNMQNLNKIQLTNEQHDSKLKAHSAETYQSLTTQHDPQINSYSMHDPQEIGENNSSFRNTQNLNKMQMTNDQHDSKVKAHNMETYQSSATHDSQEIQEIQENGENDFYRNMQNGHNFNKMQETSDQHDSKIKENMENIENSFSFRSLCNSIVTPFIYIKEFYVKHWLLITFIVFVFGYLKRNNIPVGIYYELCQFPSSNYFLPCDQIVAHDFVSLKKEQEYLLENLQENARVFNPPNDKSLPLRLKDIEMFSRDFSTVVEHSDLSFNNRMKLVNRLDEFAEETYKAVDKLMDLSVLTGITIKEISEYIEDTSMALKSMDSYLSLKELNELNEKYNTMISDYNNQLKELGSKAAESKEGLKKMASLQRSMFEIVTKEKKYQKDLQEYSESDFLSRAWKLLGGDVRSREFEDNLNILRKFEVDKVKAISTIIEIEQNVDKYQRTLEMLRKKVGKILFTQTSTSVEDHLGFLMSILGLRKSIDE